MQAIARLGLASRVGGRRIALSARGRVGVGAGAAGSMRTFMSGQRCLAEQGQQQQRPGANSYLASKRPDVSTFAFTPSAPSPSSSSSSPFPTASNLANRTRYQQQSQQRDIPLQRGAPYILHAHCQKHNTILTLVRDMPRDTLRNSFNEITAGGNGDGSANAGSFDPARFGQTVVKTSCGALGFKKAQRSTFEAATRTANKMFEMITRLGSYDRKTKHGTKIRDEQPSELSLVLKGYGQGREALIAALQTAQADSVVKRLKRVTDATPIKIGGTRPRKRRKLAPPLDLSRGRRR